MTNVSQSLQSTFLKVTTIAVILSAIFNVVAPAMAQAATLTVLSMTLASSAPATATNMRITFTNATAISGDATASDDDGKIIIRLPTAGTDPFTIGSLVASDILLGASFPVGISVNSVTLSNRGGSAANDTITIGLNQTDGVPAAININASTALTFDIVNNRITTPAKVAAAGTADIWEMSFATQANGGSTDVDNGATQVATIDTTAASATVATTLTFTVAAGDTTTYGSLASTSGTTATTVPFGTIVPNTAKQMNQLLTTTTNAPSGYLVYVTQSANLTSGSDDIDQFTDGTRTDDASSTVWAAPKVVASSEATKGHLGYGSGDTSVFTAGNYAGVPTTNAVGGAPVTTGLACDSGVAVTAEACRVFYRVEISALQEAGTYTNTLVYVVVPRY